MKIILLTILLASVAYGSDDTRLIREACMIDTIEGTGQSPWCEKYLDNDLEFCMCMKHDPEMGWEDL